MPVRRLPSNPSIEHLKQQAKTLQRQVRAGDSAALALVGEGDWVTAETVVGLVETMKIFNEVTADVSGRIVGFRAENGQLVHAGDALVLIEPGERTTAESEPRF